MIFYIIPVVVMIMSFLDYIRSKNMRKLIVSVALIIMSGFTTFRNTSEESFYGYDTNAYIEHYQETHIDDEMSFEIGYEILNRIIHLFTDDYRYLFLIMSIMTMYFLYKYISYFTNNEIVAVLAYISIFYYIRDLSQMRAALAYMIAIYSTTYIIRKNLGRFFLLSLLATSIHFSAIGILLMYPISKLRLNRIKLYIILLLALVMTNIDWIDPVLDILKEFEGNKYVDSFIIYNTYHGERGIDSKFLLYIALTAVSIYIKDFKSIKSKKYELSVYTLLLGIVIACIFNKSDVISVRLSELYISSLIITISYFKEVARDKYINITFHTIVCWFLIMYNIFYMESLSHYGILY